MRAAHVLHGAPAITLRVCAVLAATAGCGGPSVEPPDADPVPAEGGACVEPRTLCGSRCVSTLNDPAHCGGCGETCPGSAFCSQGACVTSCPAGFEVCGSSCVDTTADPDHCGGCEKPCPDGRACRNGGCACPEGHALCGSVCVNTDADAENCGVCGRACGEDEICNMGSCECATGVVETSCTDGEDDDCDGEVDCDDVDCVGATRACTASCGPGTETCGSDGAWGECTGGTGGGEICGDGIDQDCDGEDHRAPDPYEPNDDCARCTYLSGVDPDVTINDARIDAVDDEADCFYFWGEDNVGFTNEYIVVELTNVPFGHNYDLELVRHACDSAPVARSNNPSNWNERIQWEESGLDDGNYYVFVRRVAGYTCEPGGAYALQVNGLDYL